MDERIQKFIDNTYIVCELDEIKISELEKKIGRGTGFLSRQRTKPSISLQTALDIADVLTVPFVELLANDWTDALKAHEIRKREEEIERLKKEIEELEK